MIDERGGMAAIGDMNAYVQFKAAKAMQDAAQAGEGAAGSAAGAGVGLGAGLGMGMMIPGIIQNALKQGAQREISQSAAEDPFSRIKKLKELLDIGAVTEKEFEAKKADLLSKV
jgi:membrane protease subunit (stomatin/prohibitin family)